MIPSNDNAANRVVLDAVRVALGALPEAATIAIAYSGGLDSSVLLDATVRVAGAARCVALHVHHGLSPNADAWLAHAEASAAALGVSFDAQRVEVPRESGLGVEASAREVRYRALDALGERHGAQALWIAQHADDQAETVLLQLLRGAGLAGIAAMAPRYLPDGATIVRMRPLLSLLRAQLERYAEARALRWIDDESNADTRYARNALRAQVLPELAVHFPGFRDALARTAQHAAAAQRLLDGLAADDLAGVARDDGRVLSRERLLGFDDERGANLLRHWMRTLGLPGASAARLAEMIKQLRATQVSHALRIDHAGQCLRLYRDDVYWEAGDSADPADDGSARARPIARLEWAGQEIWHLPAWRGSFVFWPVDDADEAAAGSGAEDRIAEAVLAGAPLVVRARAGGERMRMASGGPSRTLKNLFQERGVPAWQRDVPLLHAGETLLFVPQLGVNRAPEAGGAAAGGAGPYRRIEWRPDLLIA
ncbi:tRNA lysidine(34) synthetase TilS [Burkholderia plantarii]|uniref:tRNA lysidine(34) synthetase TilS n=1 Tax=Burkholderia plantarii TaxID=41899 RepID=UPI00272990F3|nr:tRNA lysidine(34) synthetase TilS [Burkholderia plantarii]WLE59907.1 tRNA lysidine(34) synthetase TilS [Burkholderia plantarii]